jgi:hypothetical protein
MTSGSAALAWLPWERDRDEVSRLLTEGGDDRIALDRRNGLNAYGCGADRWTGGLTFSSTTASPLYPETFKASRRMLASLRERSGAGACATAARMVRTRLAVLCGLDPERDVDIVLAPSGTDLHRIAAACASGEERLPLVTIMPSPLESGRRVETAVRGRAPDPRRPGPGLPREVVPIAVRSSSAAPRSAAEVDAEVEAACERAMRSGRPVLIVLLDVSKTGLAAPTAACAARLKARFGARLTVLVDACQFRLSPKEIRRRLNLGFLVAVTGSKFLGGPAFSGALLIPPAARDRLRVAALPWREMTSSAREDWREAYAGRALLPAAVSLGPALRWSAPLDTMAALNRIPSDALAHFVDAFGTALAARVAGAPAAFRLLNPPPAGRAHESEWDRNATIFPLLLLRAGALLDADAVAFVFERLRTIAQERNAGHLWVGQPVVVGEARGRPVAALRLALSAQHLLAYACEADGVGKLMTLADECLWLIESLVAAL